MSKSNSALPYVICHMVTTLDGRIKTKNWPYNKVARSHYEKCHNKLKGDAWIVGRISMQNHCSSKFKNLTKAKIRIKKTDFIGDEKATSFAIVTDRLGKCRWDSNSLTGDHVVEILTEKVSIDYLNHLREKKVSYIFAGKTKINLELALKKLRKLFGIKRLLLEGGGIINGTFLKAGLINEISQLLQPLVDGSTGMPTMFDVGARSRVATPFRLKSVRALPGDVVWLRYKL